MICNYLNVLEKQLNTRRMLGVFCGGWSSREQREKGKKCADYQKTMNIYILLNVSNILYFNDFETFFICNITTVCDEPTKQIR